MVRYPTASNLDELRAAEQVADIRFVSSPGELDDAGLVVLPGSKHVPGGPRLAPPDWPRRGGRAHGRGRHAGARHLRRAADARRADRRQRAGLGLSARCETEYAAEKLTRKVNVCFGEHAGSLDASSPALELDGYEIRHGDTRGAGDGLVFVHGNVLGVSFHGLLESAAGCNALLGAVPAEPLETVFDGLADAVETHLDLEHIA